MSTGPSRPALPTSLTDLPPELLDHIVAALPDARSLAHLGRASKRLHAFVEQDGWQNFARHRFPSLVPTGHLQIRRDAARTLTALSRAWDRRAFVARNIEPQGEITSLPDQSKVERWKRPRGQSIGFAPQIDCIEDIGPSWKDRRELLAFSAGAEICVREKRSTTRAGDVKVRWWTYKPDNAFEGRDDVTSLHLLRRRPDQEEEQQSVITGTANGDLQLLSFHPEGRKAMSRTSFVTDGLPVRSSTVSQHSTDETLLAAGMGTARVSLYAVDRSKQSIAPTTTVDIQQPAYAQRNYRAWATTFISRSTLAVGLGPSEEPIQIYEVTPTGLSSKPLRTFTLQNDIDRLDVQDPTTESTKRSVSSVYPIIPLPPTLSGGGSREGQIFLSGAYDGVVRLHDLRSSRSVARSYIDPTDDSAIYSLVARGQETLVAGTSRHSLLKIFDLRLGAKAYSYLDTTTNSTTAPAPARDWSLFVKPHSATYPGRGGGNNWARRSAHSSIYALASPAPHSPYLYIGVESAALELAFTDSVDPAPDPVFFALYAPPPPPSRRGRGRGRPLPPPAAHAAVAREEDVLDLAMHDNSADLKLFTQRSREATWKTLRSGVPTVPGLDARWQLGSSG